MHACKSLVNSGVNERSQWMKNNSATYSMIWWIWEIWWSIHYKFTSNLNFFKWFNEKYIAKFHICEISHNIITSIRWFFISKWKKSLCLHYFSLYLHACKFCPFMKNCIEENSVGFRTINVVINIVKYCQQMPILINEKRTYWSGQ